MGRSLGKMHAACRMQHAAVCRHGSRAKASRVMLHDFSTFSTSSWKLSVRPLPPSGMMRRTVGAMANTPGETSQLGEGFS